MRSAGDDAVLATLVDLGNQLRCSPDLDGVVRAVATAAAATFGFNEIVVFLRVPDGSYRALATVGCDQELDRRILETPVPADVFDRLFDERHRLGCAYWLDHRVYPWPPEFEPYLPSPDLGPRADGEWHPDDTFLVPLHAHSGQVLGVLDLCDPADRRLPDLELANRLEVFATYAALALEAARQYDELESAKRQMEQQLEVRHHLLRVSQSLLSTLDHTAVFEQIADVLKSLVDYDALDVTLVDETAQELITVFAEDPEADEIMDFRVPIDQGVCGWVVRHREAQLVNDMDADSRAVQIPGTGQERQASIFAPLMLVDKVLGVLIISRLGGRVFGGDEFITAQLFANLASIAIRNARSYKEMEVQASTDGLTGLYNHRHFQEALGVEVARGERYENGFCLLMMDLDRFKIINDTVGHQQGDEVLRGVAAALRRCSRESDLAARYGGEEFAMILPHTSLDEAFQVAERIRSLVAELPAGDPALRVTISVGIASFPEAARDKDGILGAADTALLVAKSRGRDRVCTSAETGGAVEAVRSVATPLASLGYRFAQEVGLSDAEATALAAALHVVESGARVGPELRLAGEPGDNGGERSPTYGRVFEALLYGTERWDGGGYPEGLRGDGIPPVARLFALLRTYAESGNGAVSAVRSRSGKQLDPRLVSRFLAFLAEEAAKWSPLEPGRAVGRGGPSG